MQEKAAENLAGSDCAGGSLFVDPNPRGGGGGGRGRGDRGVILMLVSCMISETNLSPLIKCECKVYMARMVWVAPSCVGGLEAAAVRHFHAVWLHINAIYQASGRSPF